MYVTPGDLVGIIYDELLKQYKDPDDPETQKSLNQLCVRFVFCFYAEDADIFGKPAMFHDYLQAHRSEARQALIRLFKILDTRPEDRDPYDDEDLLAFPYVNGGLFENEDIIIPRLTPEIVDLILEKAYILGYTACIRQRMSELSSLYPGKCLTIARKEVPCY